MARISCPCNASIDLHQIPNPRGFGLIWEPLIEQLINNLVDSHKQASSIEKLEEVRRSRNAAAQQRIDEAVEKGRRIKQQIQDVLRPLQD